MSIKKGVSSELGELVECVHDYSIHVATRQLFVAPENDDAESAEVDHKMAERLIKNLKILDSLGHDPILIHMITCGGDWNYGMAMYDAIKYSQSYITTLSYAHARSMSSIIIQAADCRLLMPSTTFMVHQGTLGYDGSYLSSISSVEQAKKDDKIMMDIYLNKCKDGPFFKKKNNTETSIRRYLSSKIKQKGDWYLSPGEAVDLGFADNILGIKPYEDLSKLICV